MKHGERTGVGIPKKPGLLSPGLFTHLPFTHVSQGVGVAVVLHGLPF